MAAPEPSYELAMATGHPAYIMFSGPGTLKDDLGNFGLFFDAEVADDTVHCMVVDPRFSTADVEAYIVELGGEVYVQPPPAPPITG